MCLLFNFKKLKILTSLIRKVFLSLENLINTHNFSYFYISDLINQYKVYMIQSTSFLHTIQHICYHIVSTLSSSHMLILPFQNNKINWKNKCYQGPFIHWSFTRSILFPSVVQLSFFTLSLDKSKRTI